MGLGEHLERALLAWRAWRAARLPGALGAFHRENGARLLWQALPVDSTSTVLDVGGYRGDWTAEALWRFGCRSLVFEAVPAFATVIADRFHSNNNVTVVPAGLGDADKEWTVFVAADGSSTVIKKGRPTRMKMRDVVAVFNEYDLADVACMKVNIEGGEFDLLDRMLMAGLVERVRCFLIQFHQVDAGSAVRRERIRAGLSKTHGLVLDYPFVWERWDVGDR